MAASSATSAAPRDPVPPGWDGMGALEVRCRGDLVGGRGQRHLRAFAFPPSCGYLLTPRLSSLNPDSLPVGKAVSTDSERGLWSGLWQQLAVGASLVVGG